MKREAGAWGYNWATLSLEDLNTETWSSRLGVGRKADDPNLVKIIIVKSKEVKTRWSRQHSREWTNLAESSKESYGSKSSVLPVMMMMIYKMVRDCGLDLAGSE
jgi:SRSO17 transposase